MGNNNSGIIDPGYPVTKNCQTCGSKFTTNDGVITIKGSSPPQMHCSDCRLQPLDVIIPPRSN